MPQLTSNPPGHAETIRRLGIDRADEVVFRHVTEAGVETEHTGAWLATRSAQLAGALAERGVGLGDRVGLGLRNSPEMVVAALAAWLLGAVPVPVRWDVPDWELDRLKEVVDAKVYLDLAEVDWIRSTVGREVSDLPGVVSPHVQGICSSGSTGTPKVILSASPALLYPAFVAPLAESWIPVPRPQLILLPAPIYHITAFTGLHWMLGGDRVILMERFDAAMAVDLIERHRVSSFTATPTMMQRMADVPGVEDRDLSSLVWLQQGAASLPPSVFHRWAALIGPERIVMAYGMTEAIGLTALRGDEYLAHEGSVGRGVRGTEVRILDAMQEALPVGEIGDIYLRSPSYGGSTYLGPTPSLRATDDGFRSVGDMGWLDEDGYLYVADRRVDLIITGGANVFPAEVESALVEHPGIADVVVIGLKDGEWGRRVHAIVEPADPSAPPTFEQVREFAKARLSAYKVPKSLEVVSVIPRSEATKVNRARLVEARGG